MGIIPRFALGTNKKTIVTGFINSNTIEVSRDIILGVAFKEKTPGFN